MLVSGWDLVIVAIALFIGAMLQGLIGFGMVILAFPVIVTIEPALLPQTTMIASLPMLVFMAIRSWQGAAIWSEVGWFTLGRPLGLACALVLLAVLSRDALTIVGALVVLAGIAASYWAPRVERTPVNLATAGFVSALFGTAISIGGPPIGLLYQHEEGPRLRATVSLLMLFGSPISLIVLHFAGELPRSSLLTGIALMPVVLSGVYASRFIIPYFDVRLRPIILGISALAAFVALGRVVIL